MSVHGLKRATGQPYTIRVQRQLADHTVLDLSFIEPDDERFTERLDLVLKAFDHSMIATNEKIMLSTDRINAAVEATLAERLNGGEHGSPDRTADVSADS